MTTRPGAWAQEYWRRSKTKRPCNLVKVIRTDGEAVYFTDHDRAITFEGATYLPNRFVGLSADRRESGMRTGSQEATGIIDGVSVTLPDLLGHRYRGAEVYHVITDWYLPLMVVARHFKIVRSVTFTGSKFIASLEGRAMDLSRPSGGRHGGSFHPRCPLVLGSEFCTVNLDTPTFTQRGIRVATVATPRMVVTTTSAPWLSAFADDWFRNGDMKWRWSLPVVNAQATDSPGPTGLTLAGAGWTTNQFVGMEVRILTGSAGNVTEWSKITANGSDTLVFDELTTTYPVGTWFDIAGFCENKDEVSPVVYYADATRKLTFLFPTTFPIAVGDSGVLTVGCDGLGSTCKSKFNNIINHHGDPESPDAGKVIEPQRIG